VLELRVSVTVRGSSCTDSVSVNPPESLAVSRSSRWEGYSWSGARESRAVDGVHFAARRTTRRTTNRSADGGVLLLDESVGKLPAYALDRFYGWAPKIGHLMRRGMSVRPDGVAHSRPDTQLCERRAAFRRPVFPTASDEEGSGVRADRVPAAA
jgi:hypothetical protein